MSEDCRSGSPTATRSQRFPDRNPIAVLELAGLASRAGHRVRIAGRAMARREMGKLVFLDVVDRSGRIQVICDAAHG